MARLFSGIQPTGVLHIGNYVGVIRQWVDLQHEYDAMYCVVDLHAITVPYDPKEYGKVVLDAAATYLACGVDPNKSVIFVQSHIPEHTELMWLFSTITPIGQLERMIQFKEKSQQHKDAVSAGLLNYPVLMAADILLYKAVAVPVGEDQKQHVELTRDLAEKFNRQFGETFPLPNVVMNEGARIMALNDPTKKMSKSEARSGHAIYLLDSPDDIRSKIMGATTDSLREIRFDESRPGIYNLLVIYGLFTELSRPNIEARFEGKGYADFKQQLADVIIESLRPLQSRYRELTADPTYIDSLLTEGASKVQPIAEKTLTIVKDRVGLG